MCVWRGVCVCMCGMCVCAHVCVGVHLEHPSFDCSLDPVLSKPEPTPPPQPSLPTSTTTALLSKFSTSFVEMASGESRSPGSPESLRPLACWSNEQRQCRLRTR